MFGLPADPRRADPHPNPFDEKNSCCSLDYWRIKRRFLNFILVGLLVLSLVSFWRIARVQNFPRASHLGKGRLGSVALTCPDLGLVMHCPVVWLHQFAGCTRATTLAVKFAQ